MSEGHGDTGSIRAGDRAVTRDEAMTRAARAASGFAASGAGPGAAIAVLMRNDVAFLETTFGAGFVGAQAVPVNWHFKADEVNYILTDSGATHLVAHADLLAPLRGSLPQGVVPLCVPTPAHLCDSYGIDPALARAPAGVDVWDEWLAAHPPLERERRGAGGTMMYTSGTTGRPKGVRREPLPPERKQAESKLRQLWFGNRPGMRTAIVGPMYHSVQLSYTTAAVQAPGTVLLEPRFDAEGLLALIERERLTHVHLVPTMMIRLVKLPAAVRDRYDVSSLEFVVHGSAPCPADIKRALIDWIGPIVHEYYGTTETGMVSRSSSEEWLARPGTVGRAWPGREVRIYDADGGRLGPGAEGEVYMSLGAMPNFTYHNSPEERTEVERDGLVTSGDIGYLDTDGYLYLCDRKRDMVISGGVNIYPAEVEAVLCSHPACIDAAVFGIPDTEFGERLMAVVQLRDGAEATAAELRVFALQRVAAFKVPREIEFAAELPRDESGKIYRRKLREPYWEAAGRRI
jgi:long-chain acyl-CoA synthetase